MFDPYVWNYAGGSLYIAKESVLIRLLGEQQKRVPSLGHKWAEALMIKQAMCDLAKIKPLGEA